ncbi:MAG: hypothetical protein AAF085_01140 [Planctomycetota bacterium]
MAFRLIVSLLALGTVCMGVYIETLLSYAGVFGGRGFVYDMGYEALTSSSLDESMGDSMLTVVVYTLPECFAVLLLYHVYALIGRSLGLEPADRTNFPHD